MSEQLESDLTHSSSTLTTSDLSAFAADAEMVAEFATEAREHLAAMEEHLLRIEKDSSDLESVNAIFRAVHTVKGLAGFLELQGVQDIAHEVETLLDHARCRRLVITPALVDILFQGIDALRTHIDHIRLHPAGGGLPAAKESALMAHLRDIAASVSASEKSSAKPQKTDYPPREFSLPKQAKPDSVAMGYDPARPTPSTVDTGTLSVRNVQPEEQTVRVEISKLDRLLEMVGELAIANTLITQNPHMALIQDTRLVVDMVLLSRLTAGVQRAATSLRMVPIGHQFQRTARMVRDLSRQLGKQVVLVTNGEDTELDKSIAEALADPLLHMIRNSIDHGIETAEERALAGKDPVAKIRLAAYHQSAQVVIEVSDDGRGLDRKRILRKATERGLVPPEAKLSDAEVFQLIFEPGFSTAEKVTGISGRGVGMDVVHKHVQKLRGRIDIHSEAGVGTTFFLRLPLTLGIVEGLITSIGDHRYILPLHCVFEIFCPAPSQLRLTGIDDQEKVNLRGVELPIVLLHKRFELTPRSEVLSDGILIVTEAQGKRFCLFVDEALGKQELVIKSLGETLKDAAGFMGCAVLSDGRIGLILDVEGVMP